MSRALVCLLILAMTGVGLPAFADEPIRWTQRRLEIAGGTVFAVSYALPIGLAIRFEQGELAVPVLGPLIDLHRCQNCTGSPIESGIVAGLVVDFALQATGVALFTIGMIKHRHKRQADH
jgi:hypothetical protein